VFLDKASSLCHGTKAKWVPKCFVRKKAGYIFHKRPKIIRLVSPAKVNLGLQIVGRRSDGYHLLESLFWPIDFADTLEVKARDPEEPLKVEANWERSAPRQSQAIPSATENLVYAASARAGITSGLHVQIQKRIPMGAGLGGGSSNAGTFLQFLIANKGLSLSDARRIAIQTGADVPFFLVSAPSWVEGIGDQSRLVAIRPEITESLHFVLAIPDFPTLTPAVFERYRKGTKPFAAPSKRDWAQDLGWSELKEYLATSRNCLQSVACESYPFLAEVLKAFDKTSPLQASLSGTGSTCFGVYDSKSDAQKAAQVLTETFRKRQCSIVMARTHSGARVGTALEEFRHGDHRG
jgi:4-diphosphocytidyl-2-C-methyl-D-erythritol kinase